MFQKRNFECSDKECLGKYQNLKTFFKEIFTENVAQMKYELAEKLEVNQLACLVWTRHLNLKDHFFLVRFCLVYFFNGISTPYGLFNAEI